MQYTSIRANNSVNGMIRSDDPKLPLEKLNKYTIIINYCQFSDSPCADSMCLCVSLCENVNKFDINTGATHNYSCRW